MVHARIHVTLILLVAVAAAGCLRAHDETTDPTGASDAVAWGVHPYPRGDGSEWPQDTSGAPLTGPFTMLEPENIKVPGDGVQLDAWLLRPDVPDDLGVPVVVWAAPYFGLNNQAGNDPTGWDNSGIPEAVPVNRLVEEGYAVVILNLRGSGNSGGCYVMFGSADWRDLGIAVDWIGEQAWTNGRVGMMGLSYHGTTPWQAAGQNPEHLKTIITAGQVSNLYTFFHTPQGAPLTIGAPFSTLLVGLDTAPPLLADPEDIVTGFPPVAAERICPEIVPVLTEVYKSDYTPLRDAAFWQDRDMSTTWQDITASVFFTHGLLDYHGSGHAMEEDIAWQGLPADVPKRALLGQYGHMFPNFAESYTTTDQPDWTEVALEWLDFWLKGVGARPPGVGTVHYQDSQWEWHDSTQWPPADAREEVLYLSAGTFAAAPGSDAAAFRSRPVLSAGVAFCPDVAALVEPAAVAFVSDPLETDVRIAGNPFALLNLTSDMPGGQVAVTLLEVNQVSCPGVDGLVGYAAGTRFLAMGAADLQFYDGDFDGTMFPTDTQQPVRIDLNNVAEVVQAGSRIAVVIHYGDDVYGNPNPFTPTITVAASSQVVLPFTAGTLGGQPPSPGFSYPARPFAPWLTEASS